MGPKVKEKGSKKKKKEKKRKPLNWILGEAFYKQDLLKVKKMKIPCMTHLPWRLNPLLYYLVWFGCEFFSYHLS